MSRNQYQNGLTVVTPVKAGAVEALRKCLAEINDDIEENHYIPFRQFDTIHFARWVIFDASVDAQEQSTPAQLVFSTNYDEPLDQHLNELYDKGIAGLNHVYQHCHGYPAPNNRSREKVTDYLRRNEVGYNTLYVGTRGRTMRQIHREAALWDEIQLFLDDAIRQPGFRDQQPEEIRRQIQEYVQSKPELQWAQDTDSSRRRFWPWLRDVPPFAAIVLLLLLPIIVGVLTSATIGLAVFVGFLLLAGLAAFVLRSKEQRDEQYPAETDFEHVRRLAVREDRIVQNQMSSVTNVKPGWFRRTLLKGVLWVIDIAGRYIYTQGKLGTIPSIHYARWVMIDNGRRLVFFSNFDGSWENYLGDFIDKASSGLTAVWSNTHGFPRSRWLTGDGATDEQRFKAYARNSQVVTNVWYSAYKRLTVQNINNNSRVRSGLFGEQSPEETKAWLQRL